MKVYIKKFSKDKIEILTEVTILVGQVLPQCFKGSVNPILVAWANSRNILERMALFYLILLSSTFSSLRNLVSQFNPEFAFRNGNDFDFSRAREDEVEIVS